MAAPPISRIRVPAGFRTLSERDFRVLMAATVLQNLVMPMQFITLTFWAIDTYPDHDVLFSGLIVAARGGGMLALGLVGGALADRFERRTVLRCTEASSFLLTALLATTVFFEPFGGATIAAVLALVFFAAATMAMDTPARTASIPAVVPAGSMGQAIGLYNIAQQLTFPIVLPVVGVLNGTLGPELVLFTSLGAWAFSIPLVYSLRYTSRAGREARAPRGMLREIRVGLRYTRHDPTILAVIAMLAVMQVAGMPGVGMLGPIWMTEVLDLSRAEFGFIAMLWGLGAVVASFTFAALGHVTRRPATLALLVLSFGLAAIVFGHSRFVPLTALSNFCLGFAMSGTLVTAMSIVQYSVTEAMRGRVMGLFPLVMGLSMLNVLPVSAAGQAVGLEVVVPVMGWATLVLAAAIAIGSPAIRGGGRGGEGEPVEVIPTEPAAAPSPVAAGQ
jgi:MFS family permease